MPRPERPLDHSSDDPVVRFAGDLRALRERAGNPGYRVLAVAAGYSVTTLAEAAAGRTLPTLAVLRAYVRACGGDVGAWEQRWHDLTATLAASAPDPDEPSPYVGLREFHVQDADRFFGREELTADLVDRVARQRFVAVFGASGSGKSSLLRAGLQARWPGARCAVITPGRHPLGTLTAALVDLLPEPGDESDALLVVDQFEEIFTLCDSTIEREGFIAQVVRTAHLDDGRVRIVLGVRSDFHGHCARHAVLADALRDTQFLVGPMTTEQIRAAITRPAAAVGATVESALLAAIVADCAGRPGVLPLLSHALRETWRRRRGMTMTLAGYEAAGGIAHALAWTAEWTYVRCDERQRTLMKALFLRLTALGEGTEDTRRRVEAGELDIADPDVRAVLDQLTWARLITVDGHIEIAHEALIRGWPRLREWLAEDRDGLRIHRLLTAAAHEWDSLGRDRDALYRGVRLDNAVELADGGTVLTGLEREFLTASALARARAQAAARRRTRRLVLLVALLSVLLVVTATLAIVARTQQLSLSRQQDSGDALRVLAQARDLANTDPGTAEQLAVAAYRLSPTQQTASGVLGVLAGVDVRSVGLPTGVLAISPTAGLLVVQTAAEQGAMQLWRVADGTVRVAGVIAPVLSYPPYSATFSPDGHLLLLSGFRSAALWDVTDPAAPVPLGTLPDATGTAAFGGDRFVVTGGTVWDVADPAHPVVRGTLPGTTSAALNSDGTALARIADGHLQLWDVSRPHRPRLAWSTPVAGQELAQPVWHGTLLAVATGGTTRLWRVADIARPGLLATLRSPSAAVNAVTFSADGLDLASTSVDGPVETWDIGTPEEPVRTTSHSGVLGLAIQAAFSADDRTLVTGTAPNGVNGGLVSWYDLPPAALTVDTLPTAYGPAFSQDGRTLATVGATATGAPVTNLWDVGGSGSPRPLAVLDADTATVTPTRHLFPYTGQGDFTESFSTSRHLLVTTGSHVLRLWGVTDSRRPVALAALPAGRQAGRLSPDGRLLLDDGRLWDVTDARHPRRLAGETVPPDARFSPDGRRLVAAGEQGVVLYDIRGPAPVVLARIDVPAIVAGFSPDGRVVQIVAPSGPIMLWSTVSHTWLGSLPGTAQPAEFSPDGRFLAARGGNDGTIRLWDVRDPAKPVPTAEIGTGFPLAFSPDGHTLAVLAADGSLRLRETDLRRAIATVCATAPPLSRQVWQRYLPGHAYRPPCAGPANR